MTTTSNPEMIGFIEALQSWHKKRVGQLKQLINNSDCDIKIQDLTIEAGSDKAKAIRFGIELSLELLGELPFSVDETEEK